MLGYVEVSNHPLSNALRENYKIISDEFINLSSQFLNVKPNNVMGSVIDQKQSNGKMLYQGTIKSVFTRVARESCSPSEEQAIWGLTDESKARTEQRFLLKQNLTPTLEKIMEPYHPYVGTVGFNIMAPSAKLSMHYGMVSKYIRFHMGITCDPEAKFIVNDYAPRAWEPGKVWAFDDGDAYHGTVHEGTVDRVILILDIDKAAFTDLKEEISWH